MQTFTKVGAPRLAADCCPSHAASPEAAFADLANLPAEPRRRTRLSRLLRCPDGDLPCALRVRPPAASSPPNRAFQCDRFPNRRLDRATDHRGVRRRVQAIGIAEVLAAPRSPWQNPFVERVIGTIRRELLDHVIVLNEGHLRRRLRSYFRYYHGSRTHLALEKDAPQPRAVEPPEHGRVVALPQVGGLHHRYVRRAA